MLSPDGEPHLNPDALAEDLVIYMHDTVKEIYTHSHLALKALDAHFEVQPPSDEYNNRFLWANYIPALGAYLGQVLVAEFNGKWKPASPLMKSIVLINDVEVNPFHQAYEVVYRQKNLMDIYDVFKK